MRKYHKKSSHLEKMHREEGIEERLFLKKKKAR